MQNRPCPLSSTERLIVVATFVTLTDVDDLLTTPMTDIQCRRAQLDIDSVTEIIEGWLNRKLVDTTILDERHVGTADGEQIKFTWRPVSVMLGIRWDVDSNPLYTGYNDLYDEPIIARGQVYYVSYITDSSRVDEYENTIKRIITNVAINGVLKSDPVRYGVVNSYSVEGTSISYNGRGSITDPNEVGPIAGTDLSSLSRLRNRVIL